MLPKNWFVCCIIGKVNINHFLIIVALQNENKNSVFLFYVNFTLRILPWTHFWQQMFRRPFLRQSGLPPKSSFPYDIKFFTRKKKRWFLRITGDVFTKKSASLRTTRCVENRRWKKKEWGLSRDLNPGPPAPKAGIIPLDHWAADRKPRCFSRSVSPTRARTQVLRACSE